MNARGRTQFAPTNEWGNVNRILFVRHSRNFALCANIRTLYVDRRGDHWSSATKERRMRTGFCCLWRQSVILFVRYSRNFAFGEYISPFTMPRERASVRKADMRTGFRHASLAETGCALCVAHPTRKPSPFGLGFLVGGATRNRTGDRGVADLCLTAWP